MFRRHPESAEIAESRGGRSGGRERCTGVRGSTSLSVVLLTPLVVALMFAAVQAALWGHARTQARVAAKTAAVQVARQGLGAADARDMAVANLEDSRLDSVRVSITTAPGEVVVTIEADAPGVIVGTSRRVSVTEAVPVEEVTPR